jgi:type III restriction enzyme
VIANKYENKVIFDYPLKKFREDFYSKEVEVIESDLAPLDRALQAMILSQYKRKLFADIKQNIKPVVLLKSKTIVANKEIFISSKMLYLNLT